MDVDVRVVVGIAVGVTGPPPPVLEQPEAPTPTHRQDASTTATRAFRPVRKRWGFAASAGHIGPRELELHATAHRIGQSRRTRR